MLNSSGPNMEVCGTTHLEITPFLHFQSFLNYLYKKLGIRSQPVIFTTKSADPICKLDSILVPNLPPSCVIYCPLSF